MSSYEHIDIAPRVERNLGFWSAEEQIAFANTTVALSGAGGDGGAAAEMLVRAGIGEIRLADPENFDEENKNRQAFSNDETIGINKAEAVAEGLLKINKDLKVVVYPEGVNPDNIDAFLRGADISIDETEFTLHGLGVMIARAARKEGIPNLMGMNVGFAGTVTAFTPDGYKFEDMLGLPADMPLEEIEQQEVDLSRWLPYLPPYTDLEMFQKVASGLKSAPSVQVGVGMAASMLTVETQLFATQGISNNRRSPVGAPTVRFMDAMTGESGFITDPETSYQQRLQQLLEDNEAGLVPKVSY